MMKNQKSGWQGKVKVASAVVVAALFGAIVVQCNSKLEEQMAPEAGSQPSEAGITESVSLPLVLESLPAFSHPTTDALTFTIAGNQLSINGKAVAVDDIGSVIEKSQLSEGGVVVFQADKDQSMGFIRDVQTELRKADRRKVLYLGQTASGRIVESPLLLPPMPDDRRPGVLQQPEIDADFIAKTGIDVLYLKLGNSEGAELQKKVGELIRKHLDKGSSNYVVSAKFYDEDAYGEYLANLVHIQEGFNQVYQERSQQMFGKDFADVTPEEYRAVRQGVPRAISISEK